jgi:competence protein ComEA
MKMRCFPLVLLLLLLCGLPIVMSAATVEHANQAGSPATVVINLNQASVEELASQLKGIGRKRAQAIVDYREKQGRFISVEQLVEVPGIGAAMLEQNRSRLTLD